MSDLSRETRDLLDRGRAGEPLPQARRDRLKSAILAQAAVASIATTTTTAAAWTTMAAKAAVVVSAIAIAGTGIGLISARIDRASEARAQSAAAKRAAAVNVAPAPVAASVTPSTPVQTVEAPSTPTPIADTAPTDVTPARRAPLAKPTATTAAPAVAIQNAAPAPLPAPVASSPASRSIDPAVAPSSSLAEEARLLRDAHRALGDGDPATALALLDQHASRFPSSALEPERSAERVLALCQEGRIDDAHAAATSFLAAHPSGPLATRVRTSCAGR